MSGSAIEASVCSLPEYAYSPIQNPNSVRLLAILPAASDATSPLRASLRELSLDSGAPFFALSYTWASEDGDSSLSKVVECDGASIKITANCNAALCALRMTKMPFLVWVDAICINQADDEEKGQQIRLMHQIYSKAHWVMLWIGEQSSAVDEETLRPFSALGMEFMRELAVEVTARKDADQNVREGPLYHELVGQRKAFRSHGSSVEAMSPRVRGLWEILHRPWWSRVWAMQELAFAQTAVLLCGDKVESFDNASIVIDALARHHAGQTAEEVDFKSEFLVAAFPQFLMRDFVRREYKDVPKMPGGKAIYMLNSSRNTRATDPRDKVYGILGFFGDPASDPENIFPLPDYKKPTSQLYAEVARAVIAKTGNLDILSSCYGFVRSIPDLPSWAPSWNDTPLHYFSEKKYNAASDSAVVICKEDEEESVNSQPLLLRVKGKRVDVVEHTGPFPTTLEYTTPACVRLWRQWAELALSLPSYPTGEGLESVLMHTLCWGENEQFDRLAPGEYRENFDAWLAFLRPPNPVEIVAEDMIKDEAASRYARRAAFLTYGTNMSTTMKSYLALVSVTAKPGDLIVVLCGGKIPFVLRADGDRFKLVGPCYVHGIMDGEAFGKTDEASSDLEWFTLI